MERKLLWFTLILAALVCEGMCEKPRKIKKYSRNKKPPTIQKNDNIEMIENDEAAEKSQKSSESAEAPIVPNFVQDPCMDKHCGAGRICQISEQGFAECVCIPECYPEEESRRKVCSNHNQTWSSDCEVYQMRCWCDHNSPQCKNEEFKHLHIDYYGECKEMPECQKSEMEDFPRRMRDWLFNIMRDMAERDELTPHYKEMEIEAENNQTRRWTNAAIWKWCDLDGHPHDRSVSRHELFPIRAPLMSLEHCIAPFLNKCDSDDNHVISLKEWGKCLELPEGLRIAPDVLKVEHKGGGPGGKADENDIRKAAGSHSYLRLSFFFQLPDGPKIVWESILHQTTLYVQVSALILPKEGFVSLLDFAEELGCSQVIVSMSKNRDDFAMLLRTFMFLGFSSLPPNHPLIPRKSDNDHFFMLFELK